MLSTTLPEPLILPAQVKRRAQAVAEDLHRIALRCAAKFEVVVRGDVVLPENTLCTARPGDDLRRG